MTKSAAHRLRILQQKEERKMKKMKIKTDLSLVYPQDVKKERG